MHLIILHFQVKDYYFIREQVEVQAEKRCNQFFTGRKQKEKEASLYPCQILFVQSCYSCSLGRGPQQQTHPNEEKRGYWEKG